MARPHAPLAPGSRHAPCGSRHARLAASRLAPRARASHRDARAHTHTPAHADTDAEDNQKAPAPSEAPAKKLAVAFKKDGAAHVAHPLAAEAGFWDEFANWDLSTTGTTITLSWVAFAALLLAVCIVGTTCGCLCKRNSEGQGAAYLRVNSDGHDIY
jgi:hypothetical protein